jgi:putative membrane protein
MRAQSLWICVCMVAAIGVTACERERSVEASRDRSTMSAAPAERAFMVEAAQANLAQIDSAQIARQKSSNGDVRDFANMIGRDHSRSLEELTDLMAQTNTSRPKGLSSEAEKDIRRMNDLNSPELDREFVNMMVADHQRAIEMFRDQLEIAQNPDLKKFLENSLPVLELHLEKALRLQSKLFSPSRQR